MRLITLPALADDRAEQAEGMVADNELGQLYIAQEELGIWKFNAEPDSDAGGLLLYPVAPAGQTLTADAEGLTLYYAASGTGYLIASSQGDSRFSVYTRAGDNAYLGSFLIGSDGNLDGVQVPNVALDKRFAHGLLVVHDGDNQPEILLIEEGNEGRSSTNFKFVAWEKIAQLFDPPLIIDTASYNPRPVRKTATVAIGAKASAAAPD